MTDRILTVIGDYLEHAEMADIDDVASGILAALKAARIAAVELPRGNADWRSVDWQPVTGWDLAAYNGQVHIDEASNEPLSPHEARALAAALLAAAEASQ